MSYLGGYPERAWERWKVIARIIGEFQSRLLLSVFYFLILGPVAVVRWIFADPLHLRSGSLAGWIEASDTSGKSIEDARRQA